MSMELVVVTDERGVEIFFIDWRDEYGTIADSRWFETERDARKFLAIREGGE